jgi:hypothetical protein
VAVLRDGRISGGSDFEATVVRGQSSEGWPTDP